MTDPTLVSAASSSSGGAATSTSPTTQASAVPTSTSYSSDPPSVQTCASASTSGSRSTAPTSPERLTAAAVNKPPDSVVLGLQQLERQQAEHEQKRQIQTTTASAQPPPLDSEDDSTAPSSTANDGTNDLLDIGGGTRKERSSSVGRFIENTRKRMSSKDSPEDDPVIHQVQGSVPEMVESRLLICGYLHKLGRNGKWQKRFFETDGENLSYYKTSARNKQLAMLDLRKVGDIMVEKSDPTGCTFTIQVKDRPYSLRADSKSSCKDWVITLNRVKEARLNLGRVELVTPQFRPDSEEVTARLVLHANRKRTRAVDGENIHSWEDIIAASPESEDEIFSTSTAGGNARLVLAKHVVLARWQKRQTSFQVLTSKLVKWAKSVKVLKACRHAEDHVVLDQQIHPPGHNDSGSCNSSVDATAPKVWINKDSKPPVLAVQGGSGDDGDDDDTRVIS